MIGLHIVLKKKMHIVTKTTSGGKSISGTNWLQTPLIAPGRKHRKNAVIMIATSTAAFRSLNRLDAISCCCGLSVSLTRPPTWTSIMASICLLAVLYTDTFRNMMIRSGRRIAMNDTIRFVEEPVCTAHCCSQKNTFGL